SGSRSLVRASRRILFACCALVVQTLRPLTIQRLPRRSARVWIRDVSVPALGSVTPNAITISAAAMRGRYFCFISGVPYLMIGVGGKAEKGVGRGPGVPAAGAQVSVALS